MALTPDIDMAVEFLVEFHTKGPWLLTAIANDEDGGRDRLASRTFMPGSVQAMRDWIADRNTEDGMNIYFSVAEVLQDMNKKATRADIARVSMFHVDIDQDYEHGESVEDCQKIAMQKLHDKKDGIPKPTFIVNSGGGIQAYWKLKTAIEIGGDLIKCEEAKRHNQRLEMVFGGDKCHNVDRIMRVPGTVNWPDRRKKKKGRVPALAVMLEYSPKAVYDKNKIPPLEPVQESIGHSGFQTNTNIVISGNIERTKSLDELDTYGVNDRTKVIIIHGRHPDEPKEKDNSRSAWLFDCLCQLARAGVPDDVVYGIVTDPNWQVSESVLDKQNSDTYIKRQMERAKEWSVEPALEELNKRHAVIENHFGAVLVVEELFDDTLDRTTLMYQSFTSIQQRYRNRLVETTDPKGEPKFVKLGSWWLDHPQRRQYRQVIFAPERIVPDTFNLWRGFAVESTNAGSCQLLLDHVLENICRGNQEHADYLLNWMARAVQEPWTSGETAVVMKGGRGTGKTFLADQFSSLFGRHGMKITDAKHLVGNFNAHLQDLCVLFADEAFWAGDKKNEGVLKSIITSSTLTIELKGYDAKICRNCIHLMMASNEDWVVPAGEDERRFFVVEVGEEQKQNVDYFGAIADQMENGGREALLYFLKHRDISGFRVQSVPQTEALTEQKILSQTPMQNWWYMRLCEGYVSELGDHEWPAEIECAEIASSFLESLKKSNSLNRRGSETQVGRFLSESLTAKGSRCELAKIQQTVTRYVKDPMDQSKTIKRRQRGVRFYVLPELSRCRALWEMKFGAVAWPAPVRHAETHNEKPF